MQKMCAVEVGTSIVRVKPVFSFDSKYLLVCSGCNIKVYSIASGKCLYILKMHKRNIVSLQINKDNYLQVFSCSEDGMVIRWDYLDGKALKVYDLGFDIPVMSFYALGSKRSWFVIALPKGKENCRLYSLTKRGKKFSRITIIKPVVPAENAVAFGVDCSFVAAIHVNNLLLYNFKTKSPRRHKTGERELTCVACHPIEYIVATGDKDGRILVWFDMLYSNHPSRSIYHWHSLPVSDLSFSSGGSHIYSGGGEAALVKWNLNSGTKQIIPRLGLPIHVIAVSPDNVFAAVAQVDNIIQIISAHKIVQVIQGLSQRYLLNSKEKFVLPSTMIYDPQSSSIIMNGKPGHLQFFNVHEDTQLFSMDIVGQNLISQERNSAVINTDIEKVALDCTGKWLATIESREDAEACLEIRLKFWYFSAETQRFTLNTNIFLPHNKHINCLVFQPQSEDCDSENQQPLVVTTSDDARFKTWVSNNTESDKNPSWHCRSVGYYKEYSPASACFSEDGSLLAVAFKNTATLWTPDSNDLKAAFKHYFFQDVIKNILFGKKLSAHFLLCCTVNAVFVWDILTQSVHWTVNCAVQCIVGDPFSDLLAVFYENGLQVLHPCDPNPILHFKNVSSVPVVSAVFVTKAERNHLYFLNQMQELLSILLSDNCVQNKEQQQQLNSEESSAENKSLGLNDIVQAKTFSQQQSCFVYSKEKITDELKRNANSAFPNDLDFSCPTTVDPSSLISMWIKTMLIPLSPKKEKCIFKNERIGAVI